ncbi:MAG: vacuolar protein sorting-associated protein 54, partial [Candidatus Omnitrophica bacterium]|nr:vacuolar protein sorting-associated protein 54 [Candidatus Omnitrophota bacterium]
LLVRKGDNILLSVHLACPYVQDHRGDEEFDRYVGYLKEFFLGGEAKELLGDYTKIANDYSEHEKEVEDLYIFG